MTTQRGINIDLDRKPGYCETLCPEFLDRLRPLHLSMTYNDDIVRELKSTLNATPDQLDNLKTWVYVGRDNLKNEQREAFRLEMEGKGWSLLSKDICNRRIGQTLQLYRKAEAWTEASISGTFRVRKPDGHLFLIAPRKRSRGFFLSDLLENGNVFCK